MEEFGSTYTNEKESKKRPANDTPLPIRNFGVYIRPNDDTCMCCFEVIMENTVRIMKIIHDIEKDGKEMQLWYHLNCFVKYSTSLGWYEAADILPGFDDLDGDNKERVKRKIE